MANQTNYNLSKKVSIKCTPTQYESLRDFVKGSLIELSKALPQEQAAKSFLYSTCAAAQQLLERLNDKVAELSTKNLKKLYNFNLTAVEASCLVELFTRKFKIPLQEQKHLYPVLERIKNTTGIN